MNQKIETLKENTSTKKLATNGGDTTKSQPEKKSSIWPSFWPVAIPAYCYFFGYSSFKYELEQFGFDSAEISTAPGDVYYHAFNTFIFLGSKAVLTAKDLIIKHYHENWKFILLLSFFGFFITFFLLWLKNKKNKSQTPSSPKKKKTPQVEWATTSLLMATTFYVGNFLVLPFLISVMALGSLLFMPPAVIGKNMAKFEIAEFNCPPEPDIANNVTSCSTITLKNGTTVLGHVFHMDSKFLYVLTAADAKSIPLDSIAQREKKVHTGKPAAVTVGKNTTIEVVK